MSAMPTAPVIPAELPDGLPPKRRGGLLIGLVIGMVLVGALAAGAWFFVVPKFFGTAHAKAPAEPTVKTTVALGPVVVNLNGEARRYLRVGLSLGLPASADAKEIEEHKSQLLDMLIAVFSAAPVETLTSEEGKTKLKTELRSRMHDELHLKKILRVYFTEFVIQ